MTLDGTTISSPRFPQVLFETPLHRTDKVLKDTVVNILSEIDDSIEKLYSILAMSSISIDTPR